MIFSARWLLAILVLACGFAASPAAAQNVVTLSTQYSAPQFVAVNADRSVFVTDTTYSLSALFLVSGAYTTTPTAYDTNFATLYDSPQGLGFDKGGDVFSVSTSSSVPGFFFLFEFAPPDYHEVEDGSLPTSGGAVHGVAIDSGGNFFVADSNATIVKILASTNYQAATSISVGQNGVDHPFGIAFDSHDNLFVADQLSSSGQILEFTNNTLVQTITAGNLTQPAGIAVDSRGNLYVTDSATNTLTEIMAPDYTTAGVIDSTHFSGPIGVALDADDNIFVVDSGHNALKEILAQPAVTAVTPSAGPIGGGTTVTITGVHLTGATSVAFGANPATSFTVVSDTQITATAPAGSLGTVDVRVTTPNGVSVAAPADRYAYTAAPTVNSVSPSSGPAAGGNFVTITGSSFVGASAVTFGGTPSTSFSVLGNTLISALAPPGAAGTVDVEVTTPGGTSSTVAGDHYTYVPGPTVSAVSPNSGPTAGGTAVTISGANFTGATAVHFGGAAATSFVVVSGGQITATAPAGSGVVDVTVTTVGGTSATSAADAFVYVGAPIVSAVAPGSGPASGGTSVTISGANFTGATAVTFGGSAADFTVNSNSTITATSPAGSLGTVDVTVTTAGGTSATSSADHFTYTVLPVVGAVSPNSGPLAAGAPVAITGANFTGATAVHFGAAAATNVTVVSASQITATAPAGSAGTIDVTVTTPNGTSATSSADRYTYVAAPAVTGVIPASGPAAGGASVTIAGTNFTGATAVKFGGAAATFTVNSSSTITATSPAGSPGAVDVTVTSPGGTSATSAADQYTYTLGPTVSGLSPSSGSTAGGTAVTISGANFTGATAVRFGAAAATNVNVVSDTQIIATSPAGGAGTVDVTVTTPNGTSATNAADGFAYVTQPTVTGLAPASGPQTGGTSVTVTGSNFTGATAVDFGATSVTFRVNSATSITAVSPPGSEPVDVRVISAGGASAVNAADRFTYTPSGPSRVFVSAFGSDGNPCVIDQPCRTLQHAHDVVAAGGEIDALDPAGYGSFVISKSVSVQGQGYAKLGAGSGAAAIVVNAGINDEISLSGLVVEGAGVGGEGIVFTSAASLDIRDCLVRNFQSNGIRVAPASPASLSVRGVLVADNGGAGLAIAATAAISAELRRTRINNNQAGVTATSSGGAIDLMVRDSAIANNLNEGVAASGAGASVRVSGSTITANGTGFAASSGGALISYGDNSLDGNTTDGAPSSVIAYH